AMDEIVDRFAHKRVPVKLLAEHLIAVDSQSAAGCDAIGGLGIIEALQQSADGVDEIGLGAGGRINARRRGGYKGISSHIMIGQGIVPDGIAVIASKPVA